MLHVNTSIDPIGLNKSAIDWKEVVTDLKSDHQAKKKVCKCLNLIKKCIEQCYDAMFV